jgi:hypothetical protein
MTRLWLFEARVGVAASYLTLLFADPAMAESVAVPYAVAVLLVVISDLRQRWRQ